MSDIPRRTAARTAKLASLPLGLAGRAAAGWGRKLVGGDREEISAELMAKSAEQLFAVLGELKGGAMKFGQALSVFEAAIPDEFAAPFRESLVKLQSAAPPMPTAEMHRMLAEQFGRGWRARFLDFDETPAAAASIGQVHRAVWRDGREVAVKVQYPGAEEALRSDLRQLSRMSRLLQPLVPGLEIKPLIAELRERMEEELDYRDEAANQRAFAAAYAGDEKVKVPGVVASAPRAMVTEWVTGRKLSDVIREGTQAERDTRGSPACRVPLLGAGASGAAARRSAPGQLPGPRRRPAHGHRLRRRRAAARRPPPAAVGDDGARARRPSRRPDGPDAGRGVRAAAVGDDRRGRDRLPGPVRRAAARGDVPVQPPLVAEPGRARG